MKILYITYSSWNKMNGIPLCACVDVCVCVLRERSYWGKKYKSFMRHNF